MHDLTGFQRDVLYVVVGLGEPDEEELKAHLEEYYESEINHSRLFPNLDTLIDTGLLQEAPHDERPDHYSVTDQGHRVLQRHRDWKRQYVDR